MYILICGAAAADLLARPDYAPGVQHLMAAVACLAPSAAEQPETGMDRLVLLMVLPRLEHTSLIACSLLCTATRADLSQPSFVSSL